MTVRLFGLRWGRWKNWWAVIRDEDHSPTLKDWVKMATIVLRFAVSKPRSPEERKRIRAAYRICVRCPCHELRLHRCALCGCYQPLKMAAGGGCAAKEIDPNSSMGFVV